jgi:hypothetical protein
MKGQGLCPLALMSGAKAVCQQAKCEWWRQALYADREGCAVPSLVDELERSRNELHKFRTGTELREKVR